MIVGNLLKNVEVSRRAVRLALRNLPSPRDCGCKDALQFAMVTSLDLVPADTKERLAPIIGKYVHERVGG
jgi:5'-methylthioadenosine phosphorylase